jgi:hypothetical protein
MSRRLQGCGTRWIQLVRLLRQTRNSLYTILALSGGTENLRILDGLAGVTDMRGR